MAGGKGRLGQSSLTTRAGLRLSARLAWMHSLQRKQPHQRESRKEKSFCSELFRCYASSWIDLIQQLAKFVKRPLNIV